MQQIEYFRIIRKWWWVTALLFTATVGTMLAIAFLVEPQYEATVTLQVSAPPPQEVPLYSQFGRQAVNEEIEQTRVSFSQLLLEGDIPYRALEIIPQTQMSPSELRNKITVDLPLEASQLMHVRVHAAYSETATLLANTLVDTGLRRYGQLLAEPTANTRMFIEGELRSTREELRIAEAELTQFRIDNRVGDLNVALRSQGELIQSLKLQSDLARADERIARSQMLEEIILEREAELHNMLVLSAEYTERVDHVERVRATQSFLLSKKSEAETKENQILQLGSIQVITPARPPRTPVQVVSSKLIVLGAVVSVLTGVLLTFLLEYLAISGVFRNFQTHSDESEIDTSAEDAG